MSSEKDRSIAGTSTDISNPSVVCRSVFSVKMVVANKRFKSGDDIGAASDNRCAVSSSPLEETIETNAKSNPDSFPSISPSQKETSKARSDVEATARSEIEEGIKPTGTSNFTDAMNHKAKISSTNPSLEPVSFTCPADDQNKMIQTTPGAYAIQNPLSVPRGTDYVAVIRRSVPDFRGGYSGCIGIELGDDNESQAEKTPTSASGLGNLDSNIDSYRYFHGNLGRAIEAECVEAKDIYKATPVGTEPQDKIENPRTFSDAVWKLVAIAIGLLVVIAIAVGAVLLKQSDRNFAQDDEGVDSLSPSQYSRRDYLISVVETLTGSNGDQVFNKSNSLAVSIDRIGALDWLVEDTKNVNLFAQTDPTGHNMAMPVIPEWKLRQRYILAVLYFATVGKKWEDQVSFLSQGDECLWSKGNDYANDGVQVGQKSVIETFSDTMGVTCNKDGRVKGISLQWNDLQGTLPQELSYFADTLEELNLGGGTLAGSIPEEYERFTKLRVFALNDNCLTGTIPQNLQQIPTLSIVNFVNNPGISGSLNDFCNHSDYKEGVIAVAGDCDSNTVECECCICCNYDNFECHDRQTGDSWHSYSLDNLNTKGFLKSFSQKSCRTDSNKNWITNECPYVINTSTDTEKHPFVGQCTTDRSQEGARWSHPDFLW